LSYALPGAEQRKEWKMSRKTIAEYISVFRGKRNMGTEKMPEMAEDQRYSSESEKIQVCFVAICAHPVLRPSQRARSKGKAPVLC